MSLLGSTHDTDTLGSIIDSVLAQQRCGVDHPASGVWRAAAHTGEPFAVRAEDGWLTIDAVASDDMAAQPASILLTQAGSLPENTKLVAGVQDDLIHLRAELPLDADADLSTQLPDVITAFAAMALGVTGSSGCSEEAIALVNDNEPSSSLAERCAEAGWPAVERPAGELAVELEVPGSFLQATAQQRRNKGWSIDVPVVTGGPASDVCREATARLLLRVSGWVRLVQATLIPTSSGASLGFRVTVAATASSRALGHAFAALSIACRLCAREAAVLWCDERIARAYLACRVPPHAHKPSSPQAALHEKSQPDPQPDPQPQPVIGVEKTGQIRAWAGARAGAG